MMHDTILANQVATALAINAIVQEVYDYIPGGGEYHEQFLVLASSILSISKPGCAIERSVWVSAVDRIVQVIYATGYRAGKENKHRDHEEGLDTNKAQR